MAYPVDPLVKPSVLSGQSNGKLPSSILVSTPGQAGGAEVRLVAPAARAWRALTSAALKAGHVLKPTSLNDSFRPYTVQERIFRERYTTTYLAGRPYKTWNGQRWYQKPNTAVAAVPGTSNHGWGLAVDTGEERDSDAAAESLDSATLNWLVANEQRFGFSHEVQSEPWHIRYNTGDKIPQAVLDFEKGSSTPTEEDEMADQIVWFKVGDNGPHCYRLTGLMGKWMPTHDAINLLKFLGVKEANTGANPLDKTWVDTAVLVDGPLRNMPIPSTAEIASAVVKALPASSTGGASEAEVKAAVTAALNESGLLGLLPGK